MHFNLVDFFWKKKDTSHVFTVLLLLTDFLYLDGIKKSDCRVSWTQYLVFILNCIVIPW